jgi:hypothetical protein
MEWFSTFGFPCALLFLAFSNVIDIRRGGLWLIVSGAIFFLTLSVWSGVYLIDLVRWWSGRGRLMPPIGYEAIGAAAWTFWRRRSWVHG